tara:strand:- start:37 stop:813 length:777 start_codon:yes stop_codon:yes gene_type:complete
MEIKLIKNLDNKEIFTISKINHVIANTLRRSIISYVPTLAIEDLEIKRNDSALYDQVVAHRMGLIPLTTDLKSYKLKEECKCKGKGCAQCELKLTLKTKGPCTVLSGDIKSTDPKVKPAFDNIPITKLLENKEIEITATAVLGKGNNHVKFSPCLITFRGIPELKTNSKSRTKELLKILEDIIEQKGSSLKIKDLSRWNEAHENICEEHGVEVNSSKENFLFTIEPWGQLSAKEILKKALEIIENKLTELESSIKKFK